MLRRYLPYEKAGEQIRKTEILSAEGLRKAVELYFVRLFAASYGIFLIFVVGSAVAYTYERLGENRTENIAVRQGYGGDESTQNVILKKGEHEQSYEFLLIHFPKKNL